MNFDSGTKSGQISRRTSERQGCGTDCVVCIKRESAVFTEAGKQHGYKKTALSYLSPVGRTHAGCREDKVDHESREKTLERTWQWLNVAVSPSLKLMDKIGKLDNRDYIRQLIERGR